MKILYITASEAYRTNNVYDFDRSFSQYSIHDIFYFDISKNTFDVNLEQFDAVLFSYSFFAATHTFSQSLIEKFNKFPGLKIPVMQDDYLYFIRHRDNLAKFAINAIITIVPPQYWHKVFFGPFADLPKLQVLTGYVTEAMEHLFAKRLPLNARKWKIGYRSRPMRAIFGALCHEKYEIGSSMRQLCERKKIPCNIEVSEEKRIYGEAWHDFIRNCQVLLGTESGCNVFDFTGEIAKKIAKYQECHPNSDFWDIHKNCIAESEGIIKTNQISPRIFEAVSLGTGHILFEGEYSGILTPWKHYIPLKKDYSNIDEVLEALDDLDFLDKMIAQSYEDIVASGKYSYKNFVARIDRFLDGIPTRHKAAKCVDLSCGIEKNVPQRFSELDIAPLQKEAEKHAAELGQKYAGKNIMAYGAGEAYKKYIKYFSGSKISGIILDDKFLAKNPGPMSEAPYITFEQAAIEAKNIEGIIIFCKPQFSFEMHEKVKELNFYNTQIDICLYY